MTSFRLFLKFFFFIILLAMPFQIAAREGDAAPDNAVNVNESGANEGLHGEPWAFGRSPDREEPIWVKGRTGKSFLSSKKKSQRGEPANNERQEGKSRIKSSLDLSVQEDSGTWKVTPSQKNVRPDENRVRENKHILGAYADLEAGDDFKIKLGPELIIRDESHGDESAYSEQPDSSFGLGMKFKYDF